MFTTFEMRPRNGDDAVRHDVQSVGGLIDVAIFHRIAAISVFGPDKPDGRKTPKGDFYIRHVRNVGITHDQVTFSGTLSGKDTKGHKIRWHGRVGRLLGLDRKNTVEVVLTGHPAQVSA